MIDRVFDKQFISKFNKCLVGLLFVSQGVYILLFGKFFSFSNEPFVEVDENSVRYALSIIFVLTGFFILYRILYAKTTSAESNDVLVSDGIHKTSRKSYKSPLSLKVAIVYFLLYAILVETFFISNWGSWRLALEGQSIGCPVQTSIGSSDYALCSPIFDKK
jgi:hypothetical protein